MLFKLFRLFFFLLNSKWNLNDPPKKKILVIGDLRNFDIFTKIIPKKNFYMTDVFSKKIYILIYIKLIFTRNFKNIHYKYIIRLIKIINPKKIVIANETHLYLWNLKKTFPQKKIILLQSTKRSGFYEDFSKTLKENKPKIKYNIDYTILWGKSCLPTYKKYLNSRFIIGGHFVNNSIGNNKRIKHKYKFGFISQIADYGNKSFLQSNKKMISINNLFQNSTRRLLDYFIQFNQGKNKLVIIPYNDAHTSQYEYEKKFYVEYFKNKNINFLLLKKKIYTQSYEMLGKFEIILGLTSTLLFESLSRGIKTGFFNYLKYHGINGYEFTNYTKQKNNISTDFINKKNFNDIVYYLSKIKNEQWQKEIRTCTSQILLYDSNNSILSKIINE